MSARFLPMLVVIVSIALMGFSPAAAATEPPANDDMADAMPLRHVPMQHTQWTRGATVEADEPAACVTLGATVWFSWTPPESGLTTAHTFGSNFDTVIAVYAVDGDDALELVACNDDTENRLQSESTFPAIGGTRYLFQVGGWNGGTGSLSFALRCVLCEHGQPNDDFADALTVGRPPFRHDVDLDGATRETDEPQECSALPATAWYRLEVETAAQVDVSAAASGLVSLAVLRGGPQDAFDALEPHACGAPTADEATVSFAAQPGTVYAIQLAAEGGPARLTLTCDTACRGAGNVPQDDFHDAATLSTFTPARIERSTEAASTEPGEPAPCGHIGATVWYRLDVEHGAAGPVAVWTSGSDFDATLAVYEGENLANLALVDCVDDTLGEGTQSIVTFTAQPGRTYYVQAGGYAGASGNLVLTVRGLLPAP